MWYQFHTLPLLTLASFFGNLNVPKSKQAYPSPLSCPTRQLSAEGFILATKAPHSGVGYTLGKVTSGIREDRRLFRAGERHLVFFISQTQIETRCLMSQTHREPLGEGLAITILSPLMHYADVLKEAPDGGVQSLMLWVLINDIKAHLERTFNKVNSVTPDISIEVYDERC